MRLTPKETSYKQGKLDGISLALSIINRRDVSPASVRWLVKERDELAKEIEALE